jgi:hypothetical protein
VTTSRRIPKGEAATREEIVAAMEALTPRELSRLRGFARWRVQGMGRAAGGQGWKDLLAKAVAATYEGPRGWNRDKVPFSHHLLGVMRSISSHERDQFDPEEATLESDLITVSAEGEVINPLSAIESTDVDPQRQLEAKEKFDEIDAIANKNPLAWLIWDGFRSDMTGAEIREALSISQKDYDTALKWLRRNVGPGRKDN